MLLRTKCPQCAHVGVVGAPDLLPRELTCSSCGLRRSVDMPDCRRIMSRSASVDVIMAAVHGR
jgi:hypothetical protein